MGERVSTAERFWGKVDKHGPVNPSLGSACWIWSAYLNSDGYGIFYWTDEGRKRRVLAHRMSYALSGFEEPESGWFDQRRNSKGAQLDHLCHRRECVNPEHLRAVTNKQNSEHRTAANPSSTTGVRNVFWIKSMNRYRVRVKHNYKAYYGGQFTDLAEAERAAVALRNRLFTHNDADRSA